MKSKIYQYSFVAFALFALSCAKRNNYSNEPTSEIYKEFKINVETGNENHFVTSAAEANVMTLQVYNDLSTLNVYLVLDSATKAGDNVTNVEIRVGDPNTDNGPLMIQLIGRYRATSVVGVMTGVRSSFIDSLLNDNIPKYVNVITKNEPLGLVRGQINSNIVLSATPALSGANVLPPVVTPTSGRGFLRLTANRTLYSRFSIYNEEVGDEVNEARLKSGTSTQNGADILTLATSQLSNPKNITLTEAQYNQLLSSPFYIGVASPLHPFPAGKLRGQVR